MEAIAAFSFAVNVIQVVDWGLKVVGVCRKIYGKALQKEISTQAQPIIEGDHTIFHIACKCRDAANRLLEELNISVSHSNGKQKLILTAKLLINNRSIEKLYRKLTSYQKALETQILLDLRRKYDLALLRSNPDFDNTNSDIQNLILRLQEDKTRFEQILDQKLDSIYTKINEKQTHPEKLGSFYNITSSLELYAMSGITSRLLSELPNLSMKQCTTLIHYTLSGLFLSLHPFVLSPISRDVNSCKDFEARAQLILTSLDRGADPNGMVEVETVSLLTNDDFVSTPCTQRESAWARLLQIITHTFDNDVFVDNMILAWIELVNEFLKHGANHQELVQNPRHHISFMIMLRSVPSVPLVLPSSIVFNYQAQPLAIIRNLIRNDERTCDVTRTLQQTGYHNAVRVSNVYFKILRFAHERLLRTFFDIKNPVHITAEATWDVSRGVLDHLVTDILGISKYRWDIFDTPDNLMFTLQTGLR